MVLRNRPPARPVVSEEGVLAPGIDDLGRQALLVVLGRRREERPRADSLESRLLLPSPVPLVVGPLRVGHQHVARTRLLPALLLGHVAVLVVDPLRVVRERVRGL